VTGAGQRMFSVSINDEPVLKDFDIFAAIGSAQNPFTRSLLAYGTDGFVMIKFISSVRTALVSSIDLTPLPMGNIPVIQFSDNETPTGLVDGMNTVFLLATAPNPPSSLQLYRNGILQKAKQQDYDLSGNQITFTTKGIPQPGDTLLASYRYQLTLPQSASGVE